MTAALDDLAAAREAVSDQQDEIASFLENSFSNEFVQAEATDQDADGDVEADDVIEADISAAYDTAAADVVSVSSISEGAAAFNALSDAQQSSRIETARVDLQAAITSAQETVDTEAQDLETGVATLVSTARTKADELTDALNALDKATTSADNAATAAGSVSTATNAVTYTYADGVITASAADSGSNTTAETLDLTEVKSGKVTLVAGVSLNETTGNYEFDATDGSDTQSVTIEKEYLDALVTRVQAEYDASDDVSSAQTALASAINDVYNAQDTDGYDDDADSNTDNVDYDISYAELSGGTIIGVAVDNSVTLKLDGATSTKADSADTAIAALTDLDQYESALTQLATDEKALADFNEAVAKWEEVGSLVDQLKALNDALGTNGDPADEGTLYGDVTAAQEAIENDTDDADAPGLGITLLEGADNFTTDSDVYLFDETLSAGQSLTDFGADGEDKIYFGEQFSLVEIAGENGINGNEGDVAALEILWEQDGADLKLYVEEETFGGNSDGVADVTTITLTGVDAADVSFEAGYLSAGEVA